MYDTPGRSYIMDKKAVGKDLCPVYENCKFSELCRKGEACVGMYEPKVEKEGSSMNNVIFYYLADDPDMEIFVKDVSDGVEVLPALAVVSTSYYQIAKAKAKAMVNKEDFKRNIADEIVKTLEIINGVK